MANARHRADEILKVLEGIVLGNFVYRARRNETGTGY